MQQSHKQMEKYNPLQWSLRLRSWPVVAPEDSSLTPSPKNTLPEHPEARDFTHGIKNQPFYAWMAYQLGYASIGYISYMFGFCAWKSWDNPNIAPGSRPTTPRTPPSPCIVGASNPCLPCGLSGAVYQNLPQHPWSSMKIHRSRKPSPFKLAPFEYSQVPHQSPCAIRQVLHLESSPDGWMDGWIG